MFLNWLENRILSYSKRRFRIYRCLEHHPMSESRLVIIENIKLKRFLELSYDESPIFEQYEDIDAETANEIRQQTDLADILMAIDRLRLDAILYRREWNLRGEKSIAAAIEKAAIARRDFEERLQEEANMTPDPENPARLVFEPDDPVETSAKKSKKKGLQAYLEVSSDDTSLENFTEHLRTEIARKAKAKRVYWQYVETTLQGQECQILTFEK